MRGKVLGEDFEGDAIVEGGLMVTLEPVESAVVMISVKTSRRLALGVDFGSGLGADGAKEM